MIGKVFYWVLNMSITAAVTGLIVLAIRCVRAIPRRVAVFLWIVPFVRMCLPFGLGSPYSLMNILSRYSTRTVVVYHPVEKVKFSTLNSVWAAETYFPTTFKTNVLDRVFTVSGIVWIAVAAAILAVTGAICVATLRKVRTARRVNGNVYLSDEVDTPAVYGIIKPRIILPEEYADADLKYVILHERVHLRRSDNLWRLMAFIIAAVHWYSPLSWIFLKFFFTDLELSCDEIAASKLDDDGRREYAAALLSCAAGGSVFASAFGGAKLKPRIKNILSFKRMTALSVTCFAALTAVIIILLITNAG